MSIKKAGIPFPIFVDTHPDRDVQINEINAKYRVAGSANAYVPFAGDFASTGQPGSYALMGVIGSAGYYEIALTITASADGVYSAEEITASITMVNATTDDIYNFVGEQATKIDGIKTQVDLLDEETLNGINAAVIAVDSKLSTLTGLINDENDPAILSLRELLQDLAGSTDSANSALTAIDGYIKSATDDLENMIAGSDTLADGTVNPFKGNTNIDIMDKITSVNTFLSDQMNASKEAVLSSIVDMRSDVLSAAASIQSVVDANSGLLGHGVFGLEELMLKITATKAELTTGVANVTSDINDVSLALDVVKAGIHTKLDDIKADTTTIISRMDSKSNTRVIM